MKPPGGPPDADSHTRLVRPSFHRSGRPWRDFAFKGLEKVSRAQAKLAGQLEWILPGITATAQASETAQARLKALFDEDVRLTVDAVHVISPKLLKRYVGDPTFLAVLTPLPHKNRGLLEVDLELAHAAVDMLLGGTGEAVPIRALTDIEEGVLSYMVLDALKALAPSIAPELPRLRLEGVCHGPDEAQALLGNEAQIGVVQLKAILGPHSGNLRVYLPASVLAMMAPAKDAGLHRARRSEEARRHARRLAGAKTFLRVEIGHAEISARDLRELHERDVVLVDELTVRADRGEPGQAHVRVGRGRAGRADAEVYLEGERYFAKVTGFSIGAEPMHNRAEESQSARDESRSRAAKYPPAGASDDEATHKGGRPEPRDSVDEQIDADGAGLVSDIPLQIAVELARVPVTAEDVVGLKVGQVIDLNRVAGEPVELSVNGKVVARGELVEVEGNLGVRVLSLVS